jgi:nitric oxide reductase activation protein
MPREPKRAGIYCICTTIDQVGVDYLPHMYGTDSYVALDEVARLPYKVKKSYRFLTR